MSFIRHEEIYPCDESDGREGAIPKNHAPAHRNDESPAGYSSAGCSPAVPASASPAGAIFLGFVLNAKHFAVSGKLSLITVSQSRGSLQPVPDSPRGTIAHTRESDRSSYNDVTSFMASSFL